MNRSIVRAGALLACTLALSVAACASGENTGPSLTGGENPEGTVFLAATVPARDVMEALYTGKINRDEQGCLRVESEGGAVVVWPYGFRLVARDGGTYVKNAQGRSIGRIGGSFRMGGGFAGTLSHIPLSDADRALAESRCPSAYYWIVGETD